MYPFKFNKEGNRLLKSKAGIDTGLCSYVGP